MLAVLFRDRIKKVVPAPVLRGLKVCRQQIREAVGHLTSWWRRPNLYQLDTPERLGAVYNAATHLSTAERLFLYCLVRGTRPQRVLEIGSAVGGSASIIAAAMEDNECGKIVGIDPLRLIDPREARYYGRFTLLNYAAPRGLDEARRIAGGAFDLVFYDGPNVYSEVKRNIEAMVPVLAQPAYVVFDNGLHYGVHQAVLEAIRDDCRLHDGGLVCAEAGVHDALVAYNGLRLVRFDVNTVSDPQPSIDRAYRSAGRPPPCSDEAVFNHDVWWCKKMQPCVKCGQEIANPTAATQATANPNGLPPSANDK